VRHPIEARRPSAPLFLLCARQSALVVPLDLERGVRRGISRLPVWLKRALTEMIALTVYWPIARFAALVERLGRNPAGLPLSWYRDKSFYTMRTNAFDRFATPLEQRFSRAQIEAMMRKAGLDDIRFSDRPPFWCAVGRRRMVPRSSTEQIPALQGLSV
jgi:hypothetical protein